MHVDSQWPHHEVMKWKMHSSQDAAAAAKDLCCIQPYLYADSRKMMTNPTHLSNKATFNKPISFIQ